MTKRRLSVLVFGPIPIVIGSLLLSNWFRGDGTVVRPGMNRVVSAAEAPRGEDLPKPPAGAGGPSADLVEECEQAATHLRRQLGEACEVIVHAPFVIGGDMEQAALERWHRRTIGPAAEALAASYFRVAPDEPIRVLLFTSEQSYNRYAKMLYGDEGVSVYGYYKPRVRTLVMNISTGGGTLVHELTHALVDFDFPAVPDWFNEGLASLHEQCRFRDDGSGIDGLENWRLPILQEAIRKERLRSLIEDNDFRGAQVGLNYAQARYFCLYLQRHGKLEDYFHRFRANQSADPLGLATVAEVLPDQSWDELDEEFRRWALELKW